MERRRLVGLIAAALMVVGFGAGVVVVAVQCSGAVCRPIGVGPPAADLGPSNNLSTFRIATGDIVQLTLPALTWRPAGGPIMPTAVPFTVPKSSDAEVLAPVADRRFVIVPWLPTMLASFAARRPGVARITATACDPRWATCGGVMYTVVVASVPASPG